MSNVLNALKREVIRLAATEAKSQVSKARKTAAEYRRQVAELRRLLRQREREIAQVSGRTRRPRPRKTHWPASGSPQNPSGAAPPPRAVG